MLKKLQNILFEDEDDDILEDDDTMESPVVSQNVAPVTPQRPVTIEREPEPVVPEQPKEKPAPNPQGNLKQGVVDIWPDPELTPPKYQKDN